MNFNSARSILKQSEEAVQIVFYKAIVKLTKDANSLIVRINSGRHLFKNI